jgi:hypothetical protein
MSEGELDHMAVTNNSVVSVYAKDSIDIDGDNLEDLSGISVGGWGLRWISTSDPDRKYMIILKPNDRKTKQLAVVGRAKWIMSEFDLDYHNAIYLVRAMWGVKHANVVETLRLVALALKTGSDSIEPLETATFGGNRSIAERILSQCIEARLGELKAPGFPYAVYKEWSDKLM